MDERPIFKAQMAPDPIIGELPPTPQRPPTGFLVAANAKIVEIRTPSEKYRPHLSIDGNMWCALYGDNLQDSVAGFGKSPQAAMDDFDLNFTLELPHISKEDLK